MHTMLNLFKMNYGGGQIPQRKFVMSLGFLLFSKKCDVVDNVFEFWSDIGPKI